MLKELPSRGTSVDWRTESRGTLNFQQEASPAQEKSTGTWVRSGTGLLWVVRGGRAQPVLLALVGPRSATCLEGTTVTSSPGIFSSFRSRKPVFPPPRSAAVGNCSGYLAVKQGLTAEWRHKNKQMHPKQHSTPTTLAGSGSSWQRAGRKVAAPRPRGTSWVGVPTTSAEDEIETQEEPNFPTPLIWPGFCRTQPWLQAGYDPSFPADLSHHQELGQVPRDPVLMLLLPSSTGGRSREGSELGQPW